MRSLVAASKFDSKMYTRMTLENILVVSQWVGLYGENSENPDDEYFEYISGECFVISIILSLLKSMSKPYFFNFCHHFLFQVTHGKMVMREIVRFNFKKILW